MKRLLLFACLAACSGRPIAPPGPGVDLGPQRWKPFELPTEWASVNWSGVAYGSLGLFLAAADNRVSVARSTDLGRSWSRYVASSAAVVTNYVTVGAGWVIANGQCGVISRNGVDWMSLKGCVGENVGAFSPREGLILVGGNIGLRSVAEDGAITRFLLGESRVDETSALDVWSGGPDRTVLVTTWNDVVTIDFRTDAITHIDRLPVKDSLIFTVSGCRDTEEIWVGTLSGAIFHLDRPGGTTVVQRSAFSPAEHRNHGIARLRAVSCRELYALTGSEILHTTDGGEHWVSEHILAEPLFTDLNVDSPLGLIAVGFKGTFLVRERN